MDIQIQLELKKPTPTKLVTRNLPQSYVSIYIRVLLFATLLQKLLPLHPS